MSTGNSYDRERGRAEHVLDLGGNRQLAYSHNGPSSSRIVVLFFSGLMSVGNAQDVPGPCSELGMHWIAPTLPGMGNSSASNQEEEYHVSLARDMSALLTHLYPKGDYDELYIGGGSYGSVQAQMLYGAPYSLFPAGRKIKGCVLLAGFSPLKYHTNYHQSLNWQTWFSVGPPSRLPFRPLQRLVSSVFASKIQTLDGAKSFLDQTLFAKMDDAEQSMFNSWLEKKGRSKDDFINNLATGAMRCCQQWEGFMEVSDVIHSDWGFEPRELDEEHASKPMLVVSSTADDIGGSTSDWLVANYPNTKSRVVPGGHISSLFYMDEIWQQLIDWVKVTKGTKQSSLELEKL